MPSPKTATLLLFLGLTTTGHALAFRAQPNTKRITQQQLSMTTSGNAELSRRGLFSTAVIGTASVLAVVAAPPAASAVVAKGPPTPEDLSKIRKGYEGLQYLLANFDKETTTCRDNGGECKRDAEPVRRYLGLRSTTDPLFQIEKVFTKVKYMDLDPDKLDIFFEATEDWNTAMNLSNSMAFISQFGEYNPGGGKDEVLKYLNESKKQVEIAEQSLKKILDCLDV